MKRSTSGFTIIELLIVIVIIAILAAISVVAYNGIQSRARISAHAHAAAQAEREIMAYALQENSESISLSGSLVGYQESAGEIQLLRALIGTRNITMYTVYEVADTTGNYVPIAALSPTQGGQMFRLQTGATGSNQMSYRLDTSAQAVSSGVNGLRIPGSTVIGWMQTSEDATVRAIGYNQATAQHAGALSLHSGWNFTALTITNDTSGTSRATLVFDAVHDQVVRQQIVSWLAQKYGVSL